MNKTEDVFWMVWNPARNPPSFKHESLIAATNEAERLARIHPGQTFVVLEAKTARRVNEPMQVIRFEHQIPF